ncbi:MULTISPECIES: hypothetical protein [Cupriavidus]
MGASARDINLIVVAHGRTAYYGSVKGCGHLIWDLRFGLYALDKPDPHRVLDFAMDSDEWRHCLDALDAPLQSPIYGSTTIDFDAKAIVEDNGYGNADRMLAQWLLAAIEAAIADVPDALIPPDALRAHLSAGRIHLDPAHPGVNARALPTDLPAAAALVRAHQYDYVARLALPAGWTLTVAGEGR